MWYWLFWLILESVPSVFHGVMRLWDPVFFVVLKMWEQGPCTDVRRQIVLKWIWVFQGVVAIGKKFLRFIGIVEGLRIELSVRAHTWPPWSRRASIVGKGIGVSLISLLNLLPLRYPKISMDSHFYEFIILKQEVKLDGWLKTLLMYSRLFIVCLKQAEKITLYSFNENK